MAEAAEGDLGVRRWPTKAEAHRTRDERTAAGCYTSLLLSWRRAQRSRCGNPCGVPALGRHGAALGSHTNRFHRFGTWAHAAMMGERCAGCASRSHSASRAACAVPPPDASSAHAYLMDRAACRRAAR